MKKILLVTLALAIVLSLCACGHEHTWVEATCTAPRTCSECGETEGEPLGHSWIVATCTAPNTCSVCGETEGEAVGHTWKEATFKTSKTCTLCGVTEGEPKAGFFEVNKLKTQNDLSKFTVSAVVVNKEKNPSKIGYPDATYTFKSYTVVPNADRAGYNRISVVYRLRFFIPTYTQYMMYDEGMLCDYYTGDILTERSTEEDEIVTFTDKVVVDDEEFLIYHAYQVRALAMGEYSKEDKEYYVELEISRIIDVPEDYDGLVLRFTDQDEWITPEENDDIRTGTIDPADGLGYNFRLGN